MLDREDAVLCVHHKDHDVGLVDGGLRLFAYGRLHRALRIVESAGVDERELAAAPLDRRVDAIACRPGLVLDDRDPIADQTIEEGRLSDIRTADDGDETAGHGAKPMRRASPPAP